MQSGPSDRPAQPEIPASPPGPPAPQTRTSTDLGPTGVILLLVGWILGIVMAVLSVFTLLAFLMMREMTGRWFDEFQMHGGPFWMNPFGQMTNMIVLFSVLSVVMLLVSTVLLYLAWNQARHGDPARGGIFGIIGGAIGLVFSMWVGIVGLIGGIFVLVSAKKHGGSGAPGQTQEAPAGPGAVAGQVPRRPR